MSNGGAREKVEELYKLSYSINSYKFGNIPTSTKIQIAVRTNSRKYWEREKLLCPKRVTNQNNTRDKKRDHTSHPSTHRPQAIANHLWPTAAPPCADRICKGKTMNAQRRYRYIVKMRMERTRSTEIIYSHRVYLLEYY